MDNIKECIDKNYEMVQMIESHIPDGEVESVLQYIELIGLIYSSFVTGVYSSNILEKKIAEFSNNIEFDMDKTPDNAKVLHVMTEAYYTGGHTQLLNNWLLWDTEHEGSVVFTKMSVMDVPHFLKESVRNVGGRMYFLSGDYMEKAEQLLEISKGFERIVLYTHMYDIIPILAYSHKNWKTPVFFLNHADFRFSYGFTVADKIINICDFDAKKCIDYRGVNPIQNVRLDSPKGLDSKKEKRNITEEAKKEIRKKYDIPQDCKIITSMGADFKYKDALGFSFNQYVESLLSDCQDDIYFIIIGANPCDEQWEDLKKDTNNRAMAIGVIPREDAEILISDSVLYIVSFPMRAAGAVIARKYNIPFLSLFVIDRDIEYYDRSNVALTIDELVEKSLDSLCGNEGKYIGVNSPKDITCDEWNKQWDRIYEEVSIHQNYVLHPNRIIGRQELMIYSMLQEDYMRCIEGYLRNNKYNNYILEVLEDAEKKYDVSLLPWNYLNNVTEEKNTNHKLYITSVKWLQLNSRNISIANHLLNKGIKRVVIYGMHYFGELLWDELSDTEIEVLFGLDKRSRYIYSKHNIYNPSEYSDFFDVDLIINTTAYDNEIIKRGIKANNIRMLSLDYILDEILSNDKSIVHDK